ncbi:hypothetical protein KCM76_21460 [Zooshikella marina]|uniref:Uncharacterized protein n=1 Tax=Zooshikella ganghwensis TaxID=202772 RepID=A0A4P9VWE3_9GAMM|nr:hypothetical protein [Zooshikella ganghwensis]MBU2708576.1 hypothetical protein [Zooshikella ganghwensis]RDH46220.1 hypothetical protein B9G39_23775 [Zooshikella ganghwensis]
MPIEKLKQQTVESTQQLNALYKTLASTIQQQPENQELIKLVEELNRCCHRVEKHTKELLVAAGVMNQTLEQQFERDLQQVMEKW